MSWTVEVVQTVKPRPRGFLAGLHDGEWLWRLYHCAPDAEATQKAYEEGDYSVGLARSRQECIEEATVLARQRETEIEMHKRTRELVAIDLEGKANG